MNLIIRYGPAPEETGNPMNCTFTGIALESVPGELVDAVREGGQLFINLMGSFWASAKENGHGHILIGEYGSIRYGDDSTIYTVCREDVPDDISTHLTDYSPLFAVAAVQGGCDMCINYLAAGGDIRQAVPAPFIRN